MNFCVTAATRWHLSPTLGETHAGYQTTVLEEGGGNRCALDAISLDITAHILGLLYEA